MDRRRAGEPGQDVEVAENLGATWEGDELVTYDLTAFTRGVGLQGADAGYLSDND